MSEMLTRLVATGGFVSLLAGGLYFMRQSHVAEAPAHPFFFKLKQRQDLAPLDQFRDSPAHFATPGAGAPGSAENPLTLLWDKHDSERLFVDTQGGALYYDGKPVLSWNPKDPIYIFGGQDRNDFAIPLSIAAVNAHPLHKAHKHKTLEDYAWIWAYKPDSPELTPPPRGSNPSYYAPNDPDFKKKREAYREFRKTSVEYRLWAYETALKSTQYLLDWQPANAAELANIPGMAWDKKYNVLAARASAVESSECDGYLPANPRIANSGGYGGLHQFKMEALNASPLVDKDENGNFYWTNYEVNGKPIKDMNDFLGNLDAQMLAFQSLMARNYYRLREYIETYDPSGTIMVAHLGGAGGAKAMFRYWESGGKKGYDPADSNGTRTSKYYREFQGIPVYPGYLYLDFMHGDPVVHGGFRLSEKRNKKLGFDSSQTDKNSFHRIAATSNVPLSQQR